MKKNNGEFLQFVDAVVGTAQTAKRTLCEYAGGPADGCPLIIWEMKEGLRLIPLPNHTKDDDVSLSDVMGFLLHELWAELGTPVHGALVTEAFLKKANSSDEDLSNLKKGDVYKEFSINPKNIQECVTVLAFSTSGLMRHAVVTYKYNDNGLPEFEETQYGEKKDIGGQIAVAVREFIEFINAK